MNQSLSHHLIERFVFIDEQTTSLGTAHPLICPINGKRYNESPKQSIDVLPFLISKTCVSNKEYEEFDPKHLRSSISDADQSPVTEVTYAEAVAYTAWLSNREDIQFSLPTEAEWTVSAAPAGWHYPYKRGPRAEPGHANTFSANIRKTLPVDDSRYGTNHLGLYHMAGNVQEMTLGCYATPGSYGFTTDGSYCIAKGGDYGHCDYSARICTRGIVDIASRCTRIGFRLVAHLGKR